MAEQAPFSGVGDTETVSASGTTAAFTLGSESDQVLITVAAGETAFFVFNNSATTATIATAQFHLQGPATQVFTKARTHVNGAVIASGATAVYITPGNGS